MASFRLLGPVTAYGTRGQLPLGGPKQLSVLAVLLLHANQVVAEDRLLALVWGDRPPGRVRLRLQVLVSQLRSALGGDRILRVGEGYLITTETGEVDLQVFTDLLDEARGELADGRTQTAMDRLRSALALWNGPALGGVSEPLIERERTRLEELRLAALEERFEVELAIGRHAQLVGELRAALAEHPFRERLAAQLMLALSRCERRSEALNVYTRIRERLVEELGIEPGQELRDIQVRILNDETEASPPPPAVVAPSSSVAPAQLPRDVRGFAGRQNVLDRLDAWLGESGRGVCVISGAAGVGKTALAVHWAHRARHQFPDGQLYVDLRGYDPNDQPTSPDAALTRFLGALGVDRSSLPAGVEELAGLYRSTLAGRRVLVLLDNARDVAQVLPLLPPSGVVVITSRHRLSELVALWGAHTMSLDALADHDARALLEAVLGVRRLAAEPAAAGELIRLCAGLPLALRIAGAHVLHAGALTDSPIEAVTVDLAQEDRLAALALDGTKQSTVASAFAASYRALEPDQQRLFRLLGLIPGPDFTPATAAALTAIPSSQSRRHLRALAAAHMIEDHADDRYRFHDLVRLYAMNDVRTDAERPQAWRRLVEHYLALSTAAAESQGTGILRLRKDRDDMSLPDERLEPVDPASVELPTEIPNLVAAASHAAEQGPYPAAWFLADFVRTFVYRHGSRYEWLRTGPAILRAALRHQEPDVEAMLRYSIGWWSFRTGLRADWQASEPPDALHHLTEAIRIANSSGWKECEALALNGLGWALAWTGRPAEAVAYSEKAVALLSEIGSEAGEGLALRVLGGQYQLLGELHRAEELYLQAFRLSTPHGSRLSDAGARLHLGSVWILLGRIAEAEEYLNQAGEEFEKLGSCDGLGAALIWLVRLRWEAGKYQQAYDEAIRALELARRTDGKLLEATALLFLADTEIEMARYDSAAEHIRLVRNMVGETHLSWHIAAAGYVSCRVKTGRGEYADAVDEASRALVVAREAGYGSVELPTLRALTEAYTRWEKPDRAVASGREALELSRRTGHANEERRVRGLLEGSAAGER